MTNFKSDIRSDMETELAHHGVVDYEIICTADKHLKLVVPGAIQIERVFPGHVRPTQRERTNQLLRIRKYLATAGYVRTDEPAFRAEPESTPEVVAPMQKPHVEKILGDLKQVVAILAAVATEVAGLEEQTAPETVVAEQEPASEPVTEPAQEQPPASLTPTPGSGVDGPVYLRQDPAKEKKTRNRALAPKTVQNLRYTERRTAEGATVKQIAEELQIKSGMVQHYKTLLSQGLEAPAVAA